MGGQLHSGVVRWSESRGNSLQWFGSVAAVKLGVIQADDPILSQMKITIGEYIKTGLTDIYIPVSNRVWSLSVGAAHV